MSRSSLGFFGLCLAVSGLGWTGWARFQPARPAAGDELAGLLAERAELAGSTNTVRAELQKRVDAIRDRLWSAESLAELRTSLEPDWRWQEDQADHRRHVRLQRISPRLGEWTRYVAVLETLGERPGLSVDSLVVTAAGAGPQRKLVNVSLDLRFLTPAAPPSSGAKVPYSPENTTQPKGKP